VKILFKKSIDFPQVPKNQCKTSKTNKQETFQRVVRTSHLHTPKKYSSPIQRREPERFLYLVWKLY